MDAGLSPAVTSFYGFDASDASVLADWRAAYRQLFRRGAAFVAEGPAMRERLVQLGAPPERTHVVPLIARLGNEWEPASLETGGPARILMAGRLVEKKGFADGVAAFAEARRRGIDAHLRIVGTGPEEERLRLAVRSHGVTDDVEFISAQPRSRFRELLRANHVILQPSRTAADGDAEGGAPTTLLEAQALGRVIVATDHADIPNVVESDAAYLSPEGDAEGLATNLIRALEGAAEWPARGAAGRRFVEQNHSAERVAGLLDRLYDGVADA
jgi:colanic acid/amylovoran biosynthesis glycosyltransferase